MSEKYITLRSYHTEQFINSIELQKDKSSKRYGFRHGYDCGFKVAFEQIDTLTAKVKRYEDAMVHIHKMGCAYKGNLTGCPACYICNEFPEFNEMNKRDRSEHGNN